MYFYRLLKLILKWRIINFICTLLFIVTVTLYIIYWTILSHDFYLHESIPISILVVIAIAFTSSYVMVYRTKRSLSYRRQSWDHLRLSDEAKELINIYLKFDFKGSIYNIYLIQKIMKLCEHTKIIEPDYTESDYVDRLN